MEKEEEEEEEKARPTKRQRTSSQRQISSEEVIIFAALNGDVAVVACVLLNPLIEVNVTDELGRTALMAAAFRGHAPVVTLLLADERVG